MQRYFSILTEIGKAQLANSIAMDRKLNVTQLKVGDGGEDEGKETFPKESDTDLERVQAAVPVNMIYENEDNPHWVVFESILPDDVGGFYITELGLYDEDDNLIAIGKYPKTYKAKRSDGISTSMDLDVNCQIGNVEHVELKIDPSKVLATINYVDKHIEEHEQKENPHPQYVQKAIYEKEKWYTGIPDEPGTMHHGVFKGFVGKTTHDGDSPPNATGDFEAVNLGTNDKVYFHFVTPMNLNVDTGSHMFWFRVHGYAYGSAEIIDETFCGHCYQKDRILYNPVVQGNCSPKIYNDKYGNVILSILIKKCHYVTLSMDAMTMAYKLKLAHGDIKCVLSLKGKVDVER